MLGRTGRSAPRDRFGSACFVADAIAEVASGEHDHMVRVVDGEVRPPAKVWFEGIREGLGEAVGEGVRAFEVDERPRGGLTVDCAVLVVVAGAFACQQSRHGHVMAAEADKPEPGHLDVRARSQAFGDDASSNHAPILANHDAVVGTNPGPEGQGPEITHLDVYRCSARNPALPAFGRTGVAQSH